MKIKRVMGYTGVTILYFMLFWALPILFEGIKKGLLIGLLVNGVFAVFILLACFFVWAFDMTDFSK
jgi:hypothetical protein